MCGRALWSAMETQSAYAHYKRVLVLVCVITLPVSSMAVNEEAKSEDNLTDGDLNFTSTSSRSSGSLMIHLYRITEVLIDHITAGDCSLVTAEHLSSSSANMDNSAHPLTRLGLDKASRIFYHHPRTCVAALIGVALALTMPLLGICMCISGRSRRYSVGVDRSPTRCSGPCQCVTTLVLAVVMMAAVAPLTFSFLANEDIQRGIVALPQRLHQAVSGVEVYVNGTDLQFQQLLVDDFKTARADLVLIREEVDEAVLSRLNNITGSLVDMMSVSLERELRVSSRYLNDTEETLATIEKLTSQLQLVFENADQFLSLLPLHCDSATCKQMIQWYNEWLLPLRDQFIKLVKIRSRIANISQPMNDTILQVTTDRNNGNSFHREIYKTFDRLTDSVEERIQIAADALKKIARDVSERVSDLKLSSIHGEIDSADLRLDLSVTLRYYVFIVISSLMLVIMLLLCSGLSLDILCGCCRQTHRRRYCCGKVGASLTRAGLVMYFSISWLVTLIVASLFFLGSLSQFYLCQGLSDPAASERVPTILQTLYPLDHFVPKQEDINITWKDSLTKCHLNQSIYHVLDLSHVHPDMTDLRKQLDMQVVFKLAQTWILQETKRLVVLEPHVKRSLREFGRIYATMVSDLMKFGSKLKMQLEHIDLKKTSEQLDLIASEFDINSTSTDMKSALRNQSGILQKRGKVFDKLVVLVAHLQNTTEQFHRRESSGRTHNVTEAIQRFIAAAEELQDRVRDHETGELVKLASNFTETSEGILAGFMNRMNVSLERRIGHCGRLSSAYNSTLSAFCSDVLSPFNGYWAAVCLCVLLISLGTAVGLKRTHLHAKRTQLSLESVQPDCEDCDYILRIRRRNSSPSYDAMRRRSFGALLAYESVNSLNQRDLSDIAPTLHSVSTFKVGRRRGPHAVGSASNGETSLIRPPISTPAISAASADRNLQ